MSDDEDEGLLRIAESPSDEASFTPQKPLQELGHDNRNSDNIIMLPLVVPKKPDEKEKEEGEIDDDDEVSKIDEEIEEPKCFDMPNIHVPPPKLPEKPVEKHHENTHQNSNSNPGRKRNHHRDSSSSSSNDEKRAKNHSSLNQVTETPRSKRTSHQVASAAITACFDEEDMVLPQNSGYLVETKKEVAAVGNGGNAGGNSNKRPKKDASTNCCEKNEDTSDINEKLSIFDAPPGTTMVIEITVMYRCNEHLAFRTKGKENAEIYGILSDTGSRMHMGLAAKRTGNSAENGTAPSNSAENHLKVEKEKVRGSSQSREQQSKNEHKRNKDKKKHVSPKDEQSSASTENEHFPMADNLKLVEIETDKMHDCHFDGCQKRFFLASELNYHVTKFHRRKVIMTDTIACQTAESSFDPPPPPPPPPIPVAPIPIVPIITAAQAAAAQIPNIIPLAPQTMEQITPMPVLRSAKSPHYSDLSDDDDEIVKNVIEKNAQLKKQQQQPLQVPLQPIPQTSLSLNPGLSLTPSLNPGLSSGLNPGGFQKNHIVTPAAIRSNSAFVVASGKQPSRPQSSQIHPMIPSSSSSTTSSSLPTSSLIQQQPVPLPAPPPGLPAPPGPPQIPFIPGFHPAMLHPGMMSQFQQQQPGPSQKPQDNHKIHELAGTSSGGKAEPRLGGGGRNSLGAGKIAASPATPQQQQQNRGGIPQQQAQQQQFMAQSQAAQQQQQQYMQNMQFQQQMMAARGLQLPTQNDMLMFSMMNPMAFQQLAASQTQNLPQNPPK